jgi:hypothetical protein
MGNKIITEKDFWMCSSGAVPAQLQGTRTSNKKESGEVYITVADTATSSWIDFGCTKNMLFAALIAAVVVIVVVVAIVATGGMAAIGLMGMMAIGAGAGVVGGIVAAVDGALKCGQKNATQRTWDSSKQNLIFTGVPAITGDRMMTCKIGGVVKFAPEIKSWSHAIGLAGLNYLTKFAECGLGGAAIGGGGFLLSGLATGSLALAMPTAGSIATNVATSFTGIWGGSRVLFGADHLANEHAYGNVNGTMDALGAFGSGAVPEVGMGQRIATGQAQPSDYLLFLYLLNVKAKGSKPPVTEEPQPTTDKDGNTTGDKDGNQPKEESTKLNEEAAVSKGPAPEKVSTVNNKKGNAFEDGNTKPKPGSAEHKAARWEKYQQQHPESKMTYEEWSNRYDANIKNANKGNTAADEYQSKIGWGDREVRMKFDENGNPIEVKKGQETRNLDIADAEGKKAVEVKDYSSKKVPYNSEIQSELAFDKELAKKGWDVEWVFTDKGPSAGLEQALNSPPPIKYKIIK